MKRVRSNVSVQLRRQGMTLLELVVVMTILVALGGIVTSMLPNFLTKTHDSVTVTNITEVNKAVMGYMSTNLQYPDYFDSIISSTGGMYSAAVFNPTGTYATKYGNQAQFNGQNAFSVHALAGQEVLSLTAGGIQNLMLMQDPPGPDGATYGAYLGPPLTVAGGQTGTSAPVAVGASVVMVNDPNYVYQVMHIPPKTNMTYGKDYYYAIFGLGQYSQLVGDLGYGIFEAPVSFGEHQYEQPLNAYARMICLFRVYTSGQRCEFLGSAHPDPTGFGTATMHTEEFYQTQ